MLTTTSKVLYRKWQFQSERITRLLETLETVRSHDHKEVRIERGKRSSQISRLVLVSHLLATETARHPSLWFLLMSRAIKISSKTT